MKMFLLYILMNQQNESTFITGLRLAKKKILKHKIHGIFLYTSHLFIVSDL